MTLKDILDTDPRADLETRLEHMTREELIAECLRLWDAGVQAERELLDLERELDLYRR